MNDTLFINIKYMLRWMFFNGIDKSENITKYLIGSKLLKAKTLYGKKLEKLCPQCFYLCDIVIDLILLSIKKYYKSPLHYWINNIVFGLILNKNTQGSPFRGGRVELAFHVLVYACTETSVEDGWIKFDNDNFVIEFKSFQRDPGCIFLIRNPLAYVFDKNIEIEHVERWKRKKEDPFEIFGSDGYHTNN